MSQSMTPTELFKCLADDTRARATLLIAREGELCVCELTEALQLSQPKISRHLAQLRNCGLLQDRRSGQWVYYRLHPQLPAWISDTLTRVLTANTEWLAPDLLRLENMRNRPQRAALCQ